MHPIIEGLRSEGKWFIVPEGEWYDSLLSRAVGCCICGHEINHSYFAVLVSEGEIIRTIEVGSSCVIDLTNGYFYKQASEWHILSDDEMMRLFWKGHTIKTAYGVLYADEINKFYVSVYDFARNQLAKSCFARITEKQYQAISK